MDLTSLSQTILGLENGVELLRERSARNLSLPEDTIDGEILPIDIDLVELWVRRIVDDLRAYEKMVPRKKLARSEVLARGTCTAVFVCIELLRAEQKEDEAEKLVAYYHDISELEISSEARLSHEKLFGWLNLDYYNSYSQAQLS